MLRAVAVKFSEVNVDGLYIISFRTKKEPIVCEVLVQIGKRLSELLCADKQVGFIVAARTTELKKLQVDHVYFVFSLLISS